MNREFHRWFSPSLGRDMEMLVFGHGGNIQGFTRTMTTAIALETSKGNLSLAIGLGLVLLAMVLLINALAWAVRRSGERIAG